MPREVKLLQANLKKLQVERNKVDAKLNAKESDVVSKVTFLLEYV
jgi:hypothetical protein